MDLTGVPMLHNLGLTMACYRSSDTNILCFFRCAQRNLVYLVQWLIRSVVRSARDYDDSRNRLT